MKIGFIGLGAMGRPMAANLQRAGHAVQAHDMPRGEGQKDSHWRKRRRLRGPVHVASRACRGGRRRGGS